MANVNPYVQKDKEKFGRCTALISCGVQGSSSYNYADDKTILGINRVNTMMYDRKDIVGISVNGLRRGRVGFNKNLVKMAVEAGATIVKDNSKSTARAYNIGERELEVYLKELGAIMFIDSEKGSAWRLPKFLKFK